MHGNHLGREMLEPLFCLILRADAVKIRERLGTLVSTTNDESRCEEYADYLINSFWDRDRRPPAF